MKDSSVYEYRAVAETDAGVEALCDKVFEWGTTGMDHEGLKTRKLLKDAPENGVISDAKTFTKVWESWKIGEKMPKLDFDKVIVVFVTSVGSKISAKPMLDDKGDLKFIGLGTRDLRPGFRYDMQVVEKEGVKTINGKEIK